MRKKLLVSVLILSTLFYVDLCAFSATKYKKVSPMSLAIKKYKAGNYTGCLQDTQDIVKKDPSNPVAYYYMAMSYAQAGKQDKAIEAYSKVLTLKPNATLYEYASTGKLCLETPDKCTIGNNAAEIDKMIKYDYGKGLSNEVRATLEQKRLDMVKQQINTDKELDTYDFRKFKDYTNQKTEAEPVDKVVEKSKQPTNDEIVAAIKVLNQAGLTNFSNPFSQVNNPMTASQSPELTQLNMLMGNGNNQNNSAAMMNMLPFMLAQKNNGENHYTPQLMQAMIMNSMMPDFNYNLNEK